MRKTVKFEVQVADRNARHGWRAFSTHGRYYVNDDEYVDTVTKTVEQARDAVKKIYASFDTNWLKRPELRIVQVEVVTTYTVVE